MKIHSKLPDLSLPKSDCDYSMTWGKRKGERNLPFGEMHTDSRDKMIFPKLKEIVDNPDVTYIIIDFSAERGIPTTVTLARTSGAKAFEVESIETDEDEEQAE